MQSNAESNNWLPAQITTYNLYPNCKSLEVIQSQRFSAVYKIPLVIF